MIERAVVRTRRVIDVDDDTPRQASLVAIPAKPTPTNRHNVPRSHACWTAGSNGYVVGVDLGDSYTYTYVQWMTVL